VREDLPGNQDQRVGERRPSRFRRILIVVVLLLVAAGAWIYNRILGVVIGIGVVIVLRMMFTERPRGPVDR